MINVATGERTSLNQAWAALAAIVGPLRTPIHGPVREGDIRDSEADIAKAERLLGYRPRVMFEEGLRRTVDWVRDAASGLDVWTAPAVTIF